MSKETKKKKPVRQAKDSLNFSKIPKVRREFVDADYLEMLKRDHPEAYEWYAKFIDEYIGANIKKSKKTNAPLARHLHRSNKLAKSVFDANNRRNNDVYGVTKANGLLGNVDSYGGELGRLNNPENVENAMIAILDQRDYLPSEEDEGQLLKKCDSGTNDSNNDSNDAD